MTIIVLLILAGISISMLTGQNGILKRASEAKEKTELAQKEENVTLSNYEKIIDKYTSNLPSTEYTEPYLPNSTFSYKEGDLNKGLVIKDKDGNEYVWVEVPKTGTIYKAAGLGIINFTNEEYSKIKSDLKEYTIDYKDDGYDDTDSNFSELYQNMLKSIYTYGGFWIGRYEAGIEENIPRIAYTKLEDSDRAVVKQNKFPYNHITRDEAQTLATKMNYDRCTSSLIFGIQWDLVLKYIETKYAEQNDSLDIKSKLTVDGTTTGNYYNNLWNIMNSNVKYLNSDGISFSVCPYKKEIAESVLLTTGADKSFSLMNIFDIAGNVWEFVLENYNDDRLCVYRGGSYFDKVQSIYAKSRADGSLATSSSIIGFRIGLWK